MLNISVLTYVRTKSLIKFLRHNVKDNKKSVTFASFDQKNYWKGVITVDKFLLL